MDTVSIRCQSGNGHIVQPRPNVMRLNVRRKEPADTRGIDHRVVLFSRNISISPRRAALELNGRVLAVVVNSRDVG